MNYDELLALIKSRRSIRRFKPKRVPIELVEKVIEAGRWSPSGDNSQPWEFVVVRDDNKLEKVRESFAESARIASEACPRFTFIRRGAQRLQPASTIIIVCADKRYLAAYPKAVDGHKLADMYKKKAQGILIESVTFSIALMNMAAVSLGLGTVVWSMGSDKLKKLLVLQKLILAA